MKIYIVIFSGCLSLFFLDACNNNLGDTDIGSFNQQALKTLSGPLIHDPRLKKLIENESFEVVTVTHSLSDTAQLDQIIYIDRSAYNTEFRFLNSKYTVTKENVAKGVYSLSDTFHQISNPFPNINNGYVPVHRFRGELMIFSEDKQDLEVLTDKLLIINFQNPFWYGYSDAKKENGGELYTYSINKSQETEIWKMRKLGGKNDLWLWKKCNQGNCKYELRVPVQSVTELPTIVSDNNVGEEFQLVPDFDKINYDSLFNAK